MRYHGLETETVPKLLRLCPRCVRQKGECPYRLANALELPGVPKSLQNLTYMELQVIRLVQPYQSIIILPQGQEGVKGQVIHLPADPSASVSSLLPHDPNTSALLVRQEKPGSLKYTQYWLVRPTKVYEALAWLKLNHPQYTDIEIRPETEFNEMAEQWNQERTQLGPDETNRVSTF